MTEGKPYDADLVPPAPEAPVVLVNYWLKNSQGDVVMKWTLPEGREHGLPDGVEVVADDELFRTTKIRPTEEFGYTIAPAPDYRALRAAEYPKIGDQLDAIMKWLATEGEFTVPAELKSLAMTCMSVKAKYPKPDGVQ